MAKKQVTEQPIEQANEQALTEAFETPEVEAPKNQVVAAPVNENYYLTTNQEGKFVRKAKYQAFSSIRAVTRAEKIKMMNLLSNDDEALPLSENVNLEFNLVDVIFKPYDKVDEETGEIEYGVLVYLFSDVPDVVYVTSSKSVYFTLKDAFSVFGEPHYTPEEALKVKVVKKDGREFKYIDLKILG